ncbi:3-hydroxyphenylacetate 6 hydroxylase [Astrocystis sublimbata]|nr:3-hydroxyphenylacetate 6 hydroxylase [Astrocystis sublimbata]
MGYYDTFTELSAIPLWYLFLSPVIPLLTYIVGNEYVRASARIPGLKGPRGWPLIGSLLDVRDNAAMKYQEWARRYGDVYQVQLGNTNVVVVNSAAAAKALFQTNSHALSSRPMTYLFYKGAPSTASFTIGTSPYDESLKRKKKGAASALNRPAIQSYIPYLDLETKSFLQDLLDFGQRGTVHIDPLPMIQRMSLSLVTTINWGVRVRSIEDELFREVVHVEEELNRTRSTIGNPADHVPLLRLSPFSQVSAMSRSLRQRRDTYMAKFDDEVVHKVDEGTNGRPCIQASMLKYKEVALTDTELRSISLSMTSGGFETVANSVHWTIGHLALHPELQDKAYEEIRQFTGSGLPAAADDQKCAYILALAKEALRYFTVIPLALPRVSIKEVHHEGILIPTGSTVYMNAWACNRDPELWSEPAVFRPERWLEKPDAPVFTFGLGYRMCSAHLLATRELYLIFMRLLSSFRIEASGEIRCDPREDIKNPKDLIMAANPYRVLCIPRDEKKLTESLTTNE